MKKQTKINYILTLILVFCIGASIPVLTGSSQVTEQHSAKSEVPYCVTSPTVPAQVTFDGETIDLRRYDRRERMDREMMAFTYMHSTTMLLIKRANRYFPIIEPILKANGRSSRAVAVYARHRTGIRTGSERQRRRTLPH